MKRRTVIQLPVAAAAGLVACASPQPSSVAKLKGKKPDLDKERHQVALILLLMTDLYSSYGKKEFLVKYDSTTYPTTIFGINKVDPKVFQAAQGVYSDTTKLQTTMADLFKVMQDFGKAVQTLAQGDTVYDPADPCPWGDGSGSPTVQKLTA